MCRKVRGTHFNPHTREGCDLPHGYPRRREEISIHTPVKGVTVADEHLVGDRLISIHTPVKGVTVPDGDE